ncbi:MAG: peptidoglycan DD-metalloendopeptidase family protein, partial [Gemmatimonadetes bacterium]|nr:M23 family metallopeptidase [Gemmatimonadota bacterium]NIQ57483.1 M23 family metallopeptidase [Gemmatimonadota bacterium]NIU77647.1 peptidoglycan DD-metalloendopeptidase family protein [Gammaproteobacteria bacterium]NIX46821.1 peptidoglycan DD-metalloendopeptidase family protein [Gemmatimonadota bacterium]NIY11180.1 peptidoglycan DD-metalloendopeptidase family protein [Gemmatimonadota bacterium]
DQTRVSQFRLTSRQVQGGIAAAVLVLVVLGSLSVGFFVRDSRDREADRLTKANVLLVEELEGIRREMTSLEASLDELSAKDERYRLLANLEPLDEDVKLAGVGGPGSRTVEEQDLWQVDPELGAMAFGAAEDLDALVRRARLLSTSWTEATRALEVQVDKWERTPSILPTSGYKSSDFSHNRLHPILNVRRPHEGIDIVARRGTPVVAAAKGRITYAGNTGGDYGYMVDIDHGHGVVTRYAHLAQGSVVVRRGQTVERWEKIAEVGTTGLVTSPSIHYEVLVNGRARDPDEYVLSDVLRF